MSRITAAKKSAILLLGVLLVLLAVSFLPFGSDNNGSSGNEKSAVNEKTVFLQQINELNNLPLAVDEKITPEVKEMVAEALYLAAAAKDEKEASEKRKIEFIVKSSESIGDEVRKAGGTIVDDVDSIDGKSKYYVVEADAGNVAGLAAEGSITRVISNPIFYATLDESVPLVKAGAFWNAGYTGSGVRVAVVDTGIDESNPILQGRVAAEKDFTNTGNADDLCGHGTHVAGIIAGTKANGGLYDGVAPDAQLISVKALTKQSGGSCSGTFASILEGIKWAIDPDANPATDDGAKVISMSLGTASDISSYTDFDNELKAVAEKGVAIVVSSGNCGNGCPDSLSCGSFRGVTFPGSSSNVITVGAVDKTKNVACFSSGGVVAGVGIKPDFAAPGVGIKSSIPGSSYAAKSGTSMAAPHVSGAVALLLSKNPQLKQDDVRRILEKTALDLGDIGKDASYGFGLIDLAKALIYKEGLVFDVKLENPVIGGNTQKIEVRVYDDVKVNSVKAAITKPDGTKTGEFSFIGGSNNAFAYDYIDTAKLGSYVVEGAINYGGSADGSNIDAGSSTDAPSVTAYFTAAFKVTSLTGDFGNVEQINVSQQQFLSQNLTANITFANTAAIELNFSALLQLLRITGGAVESTPEQEIRLPTLTIAANSKATAAVNNALEVGPGNYTLRMLTDYGAGSLMNETNITVIDDLPPWIMNIGYSVQLGSSNSPQAFVVTLLEHSNLPGASAAVSASGSAVNVEYASRLLHVAGNVKDVALTIFGGLSDNSTYEAVLRFCDGYGNCAESGALQFGVGSCNGSKRLLVAKTYEQSSAFEQAAVGISGLCLSVLNRSISTTPPGSYLSRFDAVVWSTGTDLVNIDGNDAAALTDYYGKKGKVVVEGSDVAFRHGSDDFMHSVLRSELKTDLGFTVASVANMSNLNINVTRPHPVVAGLGTPVFFNATIDPFPDAVQPYNGSVELAAWNGLETTGSAIVVYEDETGAAKSLFLPFSLDALNGTAASALASSALGWLLEEAGTLDVKPSALEHDVAIDGQQFAATVTTTASQQLQSQPAVDIFADGSRISSGLLGLESETLIEGGFLYSYQFTATLPMGNHVITAEVNTGFSLKEKNYVNNVREFNVTVYPVDADLQFLGMAYSYDESAAAIVMNITVSNLGGASAATTVKAYLNNQEAARQNVELGAGMAKTVSLQLPSPKGAFDFRATVNEGSGVAEYNESNNELVQKLYICSKEKVLVVDDNDAEFFSTVEPSSSDEFMDVLRKDGYCAEVLDEKLSGTPSSGRLNDYAVVVWSAGDYFNGTISNEDRLAISNYTGSVLLEGSDLGLDHSYDELFQNLTSAAFSSDMMLNDTLNESLVLKNHPITSGISGISISKEKSPYPDSVEALDAEVVAEWQSGNGTAAITAKTAANVADVQGPYKTAYYAFSVDGVTEAAVMEKLVLNTMQWLLVRPNSPPKLQNLTEATAEEIGVTAIKVTMSEGQTRNFSVLAEDPDGDPLTYKWLLNGSLVSTTYYFAFSPKYNESGSYNLTVIVSDGQAEARAELLVTVLDTMECQPASKQLCQLQLGVCSGSNETCSGIGKWPGCAAATYLSYSGEYEAVENSCDGLDNDCDGSVDEGFGDLDEDNIADCVDDDNDNDGTKDDEDDLIGEGEDINFTGEDKNVTIEIEEDEDDIGDDNGRKTKTVRINNSNKPLLQFSYNFSKGNILLRNLTIEKQRNDSEEGFTLVRGLDLKGKRKQVFVDRLINGSNAVCVKDKEVSAITEVSGSCSSDDESIIQCDFPTTGPPYGRTGWTCGSSNNQPPPPPEECEPLFCQYIKETGQYQIYGLRHSAVLEQCTDADLDTYLPVGCSGGLDCNDNNPSINPAAAEVCNGVDDNCNEQTDENRVCNTAPELRTVGNKTMQENVPLSFSVVAVDNESDDLVTNSTNLPFGAVFGHVMTLVYLNPPPNVETEAEFNWTPTFDQSGVYAVTFNVSDGLASDYETINITVANTNRVPVFETVGNKTVLENATLSFAVGTTDPDGDSLAQLFVNVPEKLASAQFSSSTKEFKWTPTFDDSGTYAIWFTASDGQLSANEFVNVTVVNVNRLPRFENLTNQTVFENSTLQFFVNATDPDNQALEIVARERPAGSVFTGNVFSWKPTFDDAGSHSYETVFEVSDGQDLVRFSVNITVLNVNRAPAIMLLLVDPPELVMGEGDTKTFSADVSDADNDAVTITWKVNGETVSTGASMEFLPKYNESGTYAIELEISDYEATVATAMQLTVQDTLECGTGQTQLCPQQLGVCESSFETCASPGHWPGCAPANYGSSYSLEEGFCLQQPNVNGCLDLCDSMDNDCDGQADEERVCNTAPVLQIGDKTANENSLLTFSVAASDNENDTLSYNASSLPAGAVFSNATRTFEWTPSFEQAGLYTLSFNVSDGLLIDGVEINITIANVNRLPRFENLTNQTVFENSTLQFFVNATDPDKEQAITSSMSVPARLAAAQFSSANEFAWSPTFDDSGTYEVLFIAGDGLDNVKASVNITVVNVNRAPVISNVYGNFTINESENVSLVVIASDPDGEPLTYAVNDSRFVPAPATSGSGGGGSISGGGSSGGGSGGGGSGAAGGGARAFVWQTGYDDAGGHVVLATVSDGSLTAHYRVTINVANVNRPPVMGQVVNATIGENSTLEFRLGVSEPDNDAMAVSAVNISGNATGFSFDGEAHDFAWTPTFDQAGEYGFMFTASDGNLSVSGQFNVTVLNVNRAPHIGAIYLDPPGLVMGEGESKRFKLVPEIFDPDGDRFISLWYVNGNVLSNRPDRFTFSAGLGGNGTYNITIVATDNMSATSTIPMQLTVEDTMQCEPQRGTRSCQLQLGVCSGAIERCGSNGRWPGCSAETYYSFNRTYEQEETTCDGLDNDCDGDVDEDSYCTLRGNWTDISGKWNLQYGEISPVWSRAYAEHALIVENNETFEDAQLKVKVKVNFSSPQVGLCGRLSLGGRGYCVGYGWGMTRQVMLSRLNGINTDGSLLDPVLMAAGPHTLIGSNPSDLELYLKLQLNGSRLKGKVWTVGGPEPDWQVEASAYVMGEPLSSGFAGYYAYNVNASFGYYSAEAPSESKDESGACGDSDGDGQQDIGCGGTDCNDSDALTYYGALEACDSLDNDCDLEVDEGCSLGNGWAVVNGNWVYHGSPEEGRLIPISYGYGGHPIVVRNGENFSNALITATGVNYGGHNELGICGRMSLDGKGYCLSHGGGGMGYVVLRYFDGFPYDGRAMEIGPDIGVRIRQPYQFKLLINGSGIKGKVWLAAEQEPEEWQVQDRSHMFSTGGAGYYTYYTNVTFEGLNASRIG